jgi:hypothetical protein
LILRSRRQLRATWPRYFGLRHGVRRLDSAAAAPVLFRPDGRWSGQYPGEKFLSALTAGRAGRFFTVTYLANVYGPRMDSFVSRHYRPTMYRLIALAVIAGVGALIYFKWYRPKAPREGGRACPSEHQ